MARDDPQMKIRLTDALKERIDAASKESGRSMNAEILARLEASFTERVPSDLALILASLESVIAQAEVAKFEVGTQAYHLAWVLDTAIKQKKLPELTPELQEDIAKAMDHMPFRPGINEMRLTKAQIAALRVQTMATLLAAQEQGADIPPEAATMPDRILKDARRHLKRTD